jgi:hypothetical protein
MLSPLRLVLLGLALMLCGCGSGANSVSKADQPLTLTEWKTLPPATKYEIETLERLKRGEPSLREQRPWDHFSRTVLLPARRKEQPDAFPGK